MPFPSLSRPKKSASSDTGEKHGSKRGGSEASSSQPGNAPETTGSREAEQVLREQRSSYWFSAGRSSRNRSSALPLQGTRLDGPGPYAHQDPPFINVPVPPSSIPLVESEWTSNLRESPFIPDVELPTQFTNSNIGAGNDTYHPYTPPPLATRSHSRPSTKPASQYPLSSGRQSPVAVRAAPSPVNNALLGATRAMEATRTTSQPSTQSKQCIDGSVISGTYRRRDPPIQATNSPQNGTRGPSPSLQSAFNRDAQVYDGYVPMRSYRDHQPKQPNGDVSNQQAEKEIDPSVGYQRQAQTDGMSFPRHDVSSARKTQGSSTNEYLPPFTSAPLSLNEQPADPTASEVSSTTSSGETSTAASQQDGQTSSTSMGDSSAMDESVGRNVGLMPPSVLATVQQMRSNRVNSRGEDGESIHPEDPAGEENTNSGTGTMEPSAVARLGDIDNITAGRSQTASINAFTPHDTKAIGTVQQQMVSTTVAEPNDCRATAKTQSQPPSTPTVKPDDLEIPSKAQTQPGSIDILDSSPHKEPIAKVSNGAAYHEAFSLHSRIEEFLTDYGVLKKAGYDWFTTLLAWASEMKDQRDATVADLKSRNAELVRRLEEDAAARKILQDEAKLMEDAGKKLDREVNQAKLKLELLTTNLEASHVKLFQTEERERAAQRDLVQSQTELSIHMKQLEKTTEVLEGNRQTLQDLRMKLELERNANGDLQSRITALSGTLQTERHQHRTEVAQYSAGIDAVEQEKRDVETAAAQERTRLTSAVQVAQQGIATMEAAYERQSLEHVGNVQVLEAKLNTQIQELKDDHTRQLQALQAQHDHAVQTLQEQHGGTVQRLKEDHASNIHVLRLEHTDQLQRLAEEHGRQTDELNAQILQLQCYHGQEVKRLKAEVLQANKTVETEVDKAVKKQQKRIEALQGTIVESQDKYYIQISDSSFTQLLESISQQVTDLSANVGMPSVHTFDRSMDPTNFLDKKPQERDRNWTKFVRSVCWSVLLPGFFEFPLGFGCLGSIGDGFERLYHLYLLFCRPTLDGMSLEFPADKATNVWRASFFDAFLKAVKASPSAQQQHEGPDTYPAMFKANVNRITTELTEKLLRLSNGQLDMRVHAQVSKVTYEMGILSLQMGSQRAQLLLEPCEAGELVHVGDRFADEGGLTGIDATVGLMTQPCMVRIGDGIADSSSEHVIVKGRFISNRL